jgi:hypothetical protein
VNKIWLDEQLRERCAFAEDMQGSHSPGEPFQVTLLSAHRQALAGVGGLALRGRDRAADVFPEAIRRRSPGRQANTCADERGHRVELPRFG